MSSRTGGVARKSNPKRRPGSAAAVARTATPDAVTPLTGRSKSGARKSGPIPPLEIHPEPSQRTPKSKPKSARPAVTRRKKPQRTAATADRHELYQLSVQAPEVDAPFFAKCHRRLTGRPARVLREDFCGTAFLAAHWVTMHRDNRAIGVDLDGPTLSWGRRKNVAPLAPHQQERLELIQADVRSVRTAPCDVLVALNFSYSFFATRDALRAYLSHARQDIQPGGLMMLDAWGGSETQVEQEEERRVEDFVYIWEQKRFDPISYHSECLIHFRFKDGTELRNAFRYRWRQWTLPELQELMTEAGYSDVHVLWEGTDPETGDGNEDYRRTKRGEADPAWIAYVVGKA